MYIFIYVYIYININIYSSNDRYARKNDLYARFWKPGATVDSSCILSRISGIDVVSIY